ncbi:hypothetical protein F183_A09480 [Bryobacterales bacterium F-183]|nr:hypothetical protein F183_A09480 [Bryobacterales bacterium F-183]
MRLLFRTFAVLPCVLAAAAASQQQQQTTPKPDGVAAALSRELREAGLDAAECYRIRDFRLAKEELKFYWNDGYAIFAKPVRGSRLAVYFSGDMEGGDGEVLVSPPHRGERRALAKFTGSPTLNEHYKNALFVFTDGMGERLLEEIRAKGTKDETIGASLATRYSNTVRNIFESLELRFLLDLENPARAEQGMFFATLAAPRVGAIDLIFDPMARDQVTVGQTVLRENARSTFDIWTSFETQSSRTGKRPRPAQTYGLDDFQIDATLEADLNLRVKTKGKLHVKQPGLHVFGFEITERMKIDAIRIDGQPAELYRREVIRGNTEPPSENSAFLVIAPKAFTAAGDHEIEFEHEGRVVLRAGDRVFFVSSRGTWYPHTRGEFSNYDLTFRYPKELDLVSTGDLVSTTIEGDRRITRRRTPQPIRFAGFNLGQYESVKASRGPYAIEVYGNKRLDIAIASARAATSATAAPPAFPTGGGSRRSNAAGAQAAAAQQALLSTAPPDPTAQLKELASTVVGAFESMAAELGPPPIKTLTVAPIPGGFGQGFPGLVYLSTISYLSPADLPGFLRDRNQQLFYSDLLAAHEVAHQWWGNSVTAAGYQDEWLQEAFANYSAMLWLEKKRGSKPVDAMLTDYRRRLLSKMEDGRTIESAGPITLGARLQNSLDANAWRVITYEKGTWILHMLRKRLGDAAFRKLLAHLTSKFERKPLSVEDLRQAATMFSDPKSSDPKLEVFFENWIYASGVPDLKLSAKPGPGMRVSGTLTQTGVSQDFECDVPIEVSFAKGPSKTFWVRTSNEPTEFAFTLPQPAVRVTIGSGILRAD